MVVKRMERVYVDQEGHRVDIVIDRAEKRNALSGAVIKELIDAFEYAENLDDARAITLTGEGSVFCAGMDLDTMSDLTTEGDPEVLADAERLFDTIENCRVPVVVGIEGAAVAGGFELTLPADFRVIGETATYGVPEVKFGLFPSSGAVTRLPRMVGLTNAKEIALLGDYVDPEEASRMGLVNEVCPDEEVDQRTREIGDELAKRSPLGVQKALEAFSGIFDVSLEEGLQRERDLSRPLFDTEDVQEGLDARMDDREPEFEGR